MPDIFDTLGDDQPKDIFDTVAESKPAGDIFDSVAPAEPESPTPVSVAPVKLSSKVRTDALAAALQQNKLYGSATAAMGQAADKGIRRREDGGWDLPFMSQASDSSVVNAISGLAGTLAQKSGARLDSAGPAVDQQAIQQVFDKFQKDNNLSDEDVQSTWSDLGNMNRKWDKTEPARVLSDGAILPNYQNSDWLDDDKAKALIAATPAPDAAKANTLANLKAIQETIAGAKLEAYAAASVGTPLQAPDEWARSGNRKDFGTPKFVRDYEKAVADKAGWGTGLVADFHQGNIKLANTLAGLGGALGSDTLGAMGGELSEASSLVGQGSKDTGLVGSLVEELPSVFTQIALTRGMGATAAGLGATERGVALTGTLGALATAGGQSAGATYSAQIAAGDTPEEARAKAAKAGVSTAVITGIFQGAGLGGVEKVAAGKAVGETTIRDLLKSAGREELTRNTRQFATQVVKSVAGEGAEEGIDELTNAFLNADPDTNLADAWDNAVKAFQVGGFIGGAVDVAAGALSPSEKAARDLAAGAAEVLPESGGAAMEPVDVVAENAPVTPVEAAQEPGIQPLRTDEPSTLPETDSAIQADEADGDGPPVAGVPEVEAPTGTGETLTPPADETQTATQEIPVEATQGSGDQQLEPPPKRGESGEAAQVIPTNEDNLSNPEVVGTTTATPTIAPPAEEDIPAGVPQAGNVETSGDAGVAGSETLTPNEYENTPLELQVPDVPENESGTERTSPRDNVKVPVGTGRRNVSGSTGPLIASQTRESIPSSVETLTEEDRAYFQNQVDSFTEFLKTATDPDQIQYAKDIIASAQFMLNDIPATQSPNEQNPQGTPGQETTPEAAVEGGSQTGETRDYSIESLKTAFNLTDEQAVVADAIGKALGAKIDLVAKGGVPGSGALGQSEAQTEEQFNNEVKKYTTGEWSTDRTANRAELQRFAESWVERYRGATESEGLRSLGIDIMFRGKPGDSVSRSSASVAPNGKVAVEIGSQVIDTMIGSDNEFAAKVRVAKDIQEEVIHAANMLGVKRRIGATERVDNAAARDAFATYSNIISSIKNPSDNMRVSEALRTSFSAYRHLGKSTREGISASWLDTNLNPGEKVALVGELIRQVVQLHRSGEITETSYFSAIQQATPWLTEGVDVLKKVASGNTDLGPLLARDIAGTNAILDEAKILFQQNKASFEITETGKILLRGLQNPDFTSAVHEIAHAARRSMSDVLDPKEVATIEQWAGVKKGEWKRYSEEKWARAWERYFREGKAPQARLQAVFDKIAGWMAEVYQKIAGSPIDVEISEEVRAIMDKLAGRMEVPAASENRNTIYDLSDDTIEQLKRDNGYEQMSNDEFRKWWADTLDQQESERTAALNLGRDASGKILGLEAPFPATPDATPPAPEFGNPPVDPEFQELQDLSLRRGQAQNKVKGVKFSAKDEARFKELSTKFRDQLFETVDPATDPVVGVDIYGTNIQQSKQGTFYTFENGRVRTGPAFSEETPAPEFGNPPVSPLTTEPLDPNPPPPELPNFDAALDEDSVTGLYHAQTDADRARLGLPPRFKQPRTTNQAAWDRATAAEDAHRAAGKPGTAGTDLLTNLLNDVPRVLTKDEHALLLHEKLRREQTVEAVQAKLNTLDPGTPEGERKDAQAAVKAAQDAFDLLITYADAAGSRAGLSLQARKMLVNQDYSLATVVNRLKAAKNMNSDKPVEWTEKDQQAAAEIAIKLQEAQARVESLESANDAQTALIEQLTKDVERAQTKLENRMRTTRARKLVKEKLDPLVEAAKARRAARKGTDVLFQSASTPTPEMAEDLKDIVIITAGWVADKTLTLQEFSTRLIAEFGDKIADYAQHVFRQARSLYIETAESVTPGGTAAPTPESVVKDINAAEPLDKADVWKLARAHVVAGKRGRNVLDSVFADLVEVFPSITREEVAEAFTGYGTVVYPSDKAVPAELRRIRSLEREYLKQANIAAGQMPKRTGYQGDAKKGPEWAEVRAAQQATAEALRELENQLREAGLPVPSDDKKLANALNTMKRRLTNEIEEIELALASRTARAPKTRTPVKKDAEVLDLEKRLAEKRAEYAQAFKDETARERRILGSIKKRREELERRIREKDFSRPPAKEPVNTDATRKAQYEFDKLRSEYDQMRHDYLLQNAPVTTKAAHYVMSSSNLLKLLTLGMDIGVVMRQLGTSYQALTRDLGMLAPTAEGAKRRADGSYLKRIIGAGIKAFGSSEAEHAAFERLRERPMAGWDKMSGLVLNAPFDLQRNSKEDIPTANLIDEIPWWVWPAFAGLKVSLMGTSFPASAAIIGLGAATKPLMKALDRAQRTMTNESRALFFDESLAALHDGHPTVQEAKAIAKAVMVGTGRGTATQKIEAAIPLLNQVLLATRYYFSRIQALSLYPLVNKDARAGGSLLKPSDAQKQIAQMYGRSVAGRAMLYGLAALAFGKALTGDDDDPEEGLIVDPFNPNLGRVKLADGVSLDFMSGFNNFASAAARYFWEVRTDPQTGRKIALGSGYANNVNDEALRFLQSKMNIQLGMALNIKKGEFYGGKPATFANTIEEVTTAIIVNDTLNTYKAMIEEYGPVEGAAKATVFMSLMFGGAGTSVQDNEAVKEANKAARKEAEWARKQREAELNQ